MKSSPYLSVVIPAYNEERNIKGGVLEDVYHFLNAQPYQYELLLVDDGSTDETNELLRQFVHGKKNLRVLSSEHQGKAGAVTKGVLQSSGDIILLLILIRRRPFKNSINCFITSNHTMS